MINEYTRICKKCGIEKPLDCFEKHFKNKTEYYRWTCRDCKRKERLVYEQQYRKKNYKKKSEINAKWAKKNKEKIYADRKKKRKEDNIYRRIELLRNRTWKAFNRKGEKISEELENIFGCSGKEFYEYLRSTYYENYGEEYTEDKEVNIDHIVPLVTAKTTEEVYKLFNYKNMQLLTPYHNKRKWCKESWSLNTLFDYKKSEND